MRAWWDKYFFKSDLVVFVIWPREAGGKVRIRSSTEENKTPYQIRHTEPN